MKHPATRELFAYWDGLRGERAAPERNEIEPTAIRQILADTFMLDVDSTWRFPFRLAGTRVNGLFDAEQKGCSFLDLWRAPERRNIAAVLQTVADGATPVVAGIAGSPRGHEPCSFELLLLPLRHFGKTHSRILGMITATEQPAWLGLLPLQPLTLQSLRIIDETRRGFVGGSDVDAQTVSLGFDKAIKLKVIDPASEEQVGDDGATLTREDARGIVAELGTLRPDRPRFRVVQGGLDIR